LIVFAIPISFLILIVFHVTMYLFDKLDELGVAVNSDNPPSDTVIKSLQVRYWLFYCVVTFVILITAQLAYSVYKRHVINNRHYIELSGYDQISHTIRSLDHASAKYTTIGMMAAQVALISVLVFGAIVFNLFQSTSEFLAKTENQKKSSDSTNNAKKGDKPKASDKHNKSSKDTANKKRGDNNSKGKNVEKDAEESGGSNSFLVAIILLLRTSLLGTFIVTFIIQVIKFVSSSFDQAVRFKKRKHATLFMLQLMSHPDSIKEIDKVMDAFKEWNTNVESAYTPHKNSIKDTPAKVDKNEEMVDMLKEILKNTKQGSTS
jgi:hypothetical protein